MPRLISPDGSETVDVPDSMAEHYLKLGARYAPPDLPQGLQDPGLLDPTNYLPFGGVGNAAAKIAGRGLETGLQDALIGAGRSGGRQVASAVGSLAGRLKDALPSIGQEIGRATIGGERTAALGRMGEIAGGVLKGEAPQVGTAAARAAAPVAESAAPAARHLAEIRPLHANASAEEKAAHQIELELAMAREKLPDAAKKRILQALGHEPPPRGHVAGRIEPGPSGPKATVEPPRPGTAAARAANDNPTLLAKPRPEGWDTPFSRHEHGYWSNSNQAKIAIETMSQNHLLSALEKRTAELARYGANAEKRAPVKWSELQALKKELAWRAEHGGVNVQGLRAGQRAVQGGN